MEVKTQDSFVDFSIKVEPAEVECEETAQHVIETEVEMYERHGQLHSNFIIVSINYFHKMLIFRYT
jgi:hypothetical protein